MGDIIIGCVLVSIFILIIYIFVYMPFKSRKKDKVKSESEIKGTGVYGLISGKTFVGYSGGYSGKYIKYKAKVEILEEYDNGKVRVRYNKADISCSCNGYLDTLYDELIRTEIYIEKENLSIMENANILLTLDDLNKLIMGDSIDINGKSIKLDNISSNEVLDIIINSKI